MALRALGKAVKGRYAGSAIQRADHRAGAIAGGFGPKGGSGAAAVGLGATLGLVNSFDSEGIVDYAEDLAFGTTTADEAIMGTPMGVGDLAMGAMAPKWGIPPRRFLNKQISSYQDEGSDDFRKSFYHDADVMPIPTQANRRSSGLRTNVDGSIVFGMKNLAHGQPYY